MARTMVRCCLFVLLGLALPLARAAAAESDGHATPTWMEALLADAQAEVPAAAVAAPVVALALPCSPDCDALNGTACSPVGAKTKCYVPIPGGCQAFTCRCSGGGWACP